MKVTPLVVWRFGVANTSISVSIMGYLGTEHAPQSTYQDFFGLVNCWPEYLNLIRLLPHSLHAPGC